MVGLSPPFYTLKDGSILYIFQVSFVPTSLTMAEPYLYGELGTPTSFRVAELLPGKKDDPIRCLLHLVEWANLLDYEAISYAWGNAADKMSILVHEKPLNVTRNLSIALNHLRYEDRSRYIWVDAIWSVHAFFESCL